MNIITYRTALSLVSIVALTLILAATTAGLAGAATPIKEVLSTRVGWEVNPASKGDICQVEAGTECSPGAENSQAGGFAYATGVAVDEDAGSPLHGDFYITDTGNQRVQEFSATGQFVAMFGWEVNKTKVNEGANASQAEKNVCSAESHDECQAGVEGPAPGQFSRPESIAIDPSTGNVFVQDYNNWRVQEFTPTGEFVLMLGKDVNKTTGLNLCTEHEVQVEGVKCRAGEAAGQDSSEPSAFNFEGTGNLLTVAGAEHLLYIGDEQRIQKFKANGAPAGEIPLTAISPEPGVITALAVNETGDAYLVYRLNGSGTNTIHELASDGTLLKNIEPPNELAIGAGSGEVRIEALALNQNEQLAIGGVQIFSARGGPGEERRRFGKVLDGTTGRFISEFAAASTEGIAFGEGNVLAAVAQLSVGNGMELLLYKPVLIGELAALPVVCAAGAAAGSDAVFDCALNGQVDPAGVSETQAWYEWGPYGVLGTATAKQLVAVAGPIAAVVSVEPNETFSYRLAGYDHEVQAPSDPFTSETLSFKTPLVAPVLVGQPSASFLSSSTAVLFSEVNPEHSNTRYEFQYGACENLESCPSAVTLPSLESGVYGGIGATEAATGLQPGTLYHFRLLADNQQEVAGRQEGGIATGPQSTFMTAPAVLPHALTGAVSAIGVTTATVAGTVYPEGRASAYTVELGVYAGAATQYGVVFSGSTAIGFAPLEVSQVLSGLQPGSTYAYRFKIAGQSSLTTGTFTTEGLPAILVPPAPLAQLAVPSITFPTTASDSQGKPGAKSKKKGESKQRKARKAKQRKSKPIRAGRRRS
ncbi:MAG TPA: hypothetical protein VGL57_02010 [Solirubrobacteraceae bacterium]|jgi:hypothetical protein